MPGRHINDHQMRLYMKSRLTEKKPASAAQAAMSLRTAYRIESDARLPSQKALPRGRRRPDPLVSIFDPEIVPMLQATPGLRAVAIFEAHIPLFSDVISRGCGGGDFGTQVASR